MHAHEVTLPEVALVAGTRAAMGAGIGLLVAGLMNDGARRGAGWALFAIGVLTTIPLALELFGKQRSNASERRSTTAEDGRTPSMSLSR